MIDDLLRPDEQAILDELDKYSSAFFQGHNTPLMLEARLLLDRLREARRYIQAAQQTFRAMGWYAEDGPFSLERIDAALAETEVFNA